MFMAAYSSRAPSPPYIHVPPPLHPNLANPTNIILTNTTTTTTTTTTDAREILMTIHPSPAAVHTTGLTPDELATITGGTPQSARASVWVYEARRAAQAVLGFLWLGPASAAKDRAFLAREGITMVLCARDAQFAGAGMLVGGARRAVEGMGVEVEGIDIADGREMVGVFSVAAGVVNRHVLGLAREGRKGKVLVVCETGNGRSAAVVAAYLMTMYGLGIVQAVQFMQLQRFCVALGDDFKFQLSTYEDILKARGDVGVMSHQQAQGQQQPGATGQVGGNVKRRIEQTEEAEEGGGNDMVMEMDNERYASRNFAPFVDRGY
ncbi:protein-tyrosine phosphatase-like protein [Chaetomium sp. MPI-CAGE-AT-0009]|nr:protein-tyrosine phosphatase-like protein [Chaetomium sp. MPI-CAGE-AT-0009]